MSRKRGAEGGLPDKKKLSYKARPLKDYKLMNGEDKKKRRDFKKSKVFIILVIILIIILATTVVAILTEFGIIENPLENSFSKPELFMARDLCSLIAGQLIHTINDEDSCRMVCNTECGVMEKKFHSLEFAKRDGDCNECKCYCK